jgi:hypothetical protein
MNLPTPTPQEVEEFKELYLRKYKKQLTDEEAWDAATRVLRLFYMCAYE